MHCVSEDPASVMNSDTFMSSVPGVPLDYPMAMNGLGYPQPATTQSFGYNIRVSPAQRKAAAMQRAMARRMSGLACASCMPLSGLGALMAAQNAHANIRNAFRLGSIRFKGHSGLQGYMGYLGETAAQAKAAASKAKTAANQAAAAAKKVATLTTQLAKAKTPTQAANIGKQLTAAITKSTAAAATKVTAQNTATTAQANVTAAAPKQTAAQKKAAKAALTPAQQAVANNANAALTAFKQSLSVKIPAQTKQLQTLQAQLAARKRAPAKTVKGLWGWLGDYCDPVAGWVQDPNTQPLDPSSCPVGTGAGVGPTQLTTINPATGAVMAPSASGGINPAMLMAMSGSGGSSNNAALMALMSSNGSSDPMSMIVEMMAANQGTPPKNCTQTSTRPACVMYYQGQQQQQNMMIMLMAIDQMNQQSQALDQQIMQVMQELASGGVGAGAGAATGGCPAGMMLDPMGSGTCVPATGAAAYPTAYPPPSAYPTSPYPTPAGAPPIVDPSVDPATGIPYAVEQQQAAQASMSMPVPSAYAPPPQMGPMPYAPGGGASIMDPGAPSPYDPNMAQAYAGMPSLTDPYGDVAALPPGFGDSTGGGSDSMPIDMSVTAGPLVYTDYSSDVAALPPGAVDTSGGVDDGSMPGEIDPYGDIAAGNGLVTQMQTPPGAMPAQAPNGQYPQLPAPQNQQSAIAQAQPPMNIIQSAPDSQDTGPLATESQDQIMADYTGDDSSSEFG